MGEISSLKGLSPSLEGFYPVDVALGDRGLVALAVLGEGLDLVTLGGFSNPDGSMGLIWPAADPGLPLVWTIAEPNHLIND